MLVKTKGSAIVGIDAVTITIEVNVSMGQGYCIVGLPDNAVKESLDRTESAIKSNGFHMPRTKLVINLSPADLKKSGAAFDLPIAIGILAASEQILQPSLIENYLFMGELGLDGSLYPIKGILAMAMQAKEEGFAAMIIPTQNAAEALMVEGISVFSFSSLNEVVYFLNNPCHKKEYSRQEASAMLSEKIQTNSIPDFADIKGQSEAKRALEIASAGGHNLIMIGPPGAGKTMLSKSIVSILPPLNKNEALETSKIYSVSGKIPLQNQLISKRPFRQPHHSLSAIAMIGGGGHPQPGEISLAHNGVLFLDELPEFKRDVLEVMRQPLEDHLVLISRAKWSIEFPANFMLIASMNPCPCGYFNHPTKDCTCGQEVVKRYLNKISGPLLDRIDLQIEVSPVDFVDIRSSEIAETSETIRARVIEARKLQQTRFKNHPNVHANAGMTSQQVSEFCPLTPEVEQLLQHAMNRLGLSARAYERILKVTRTIADLAGNPIIDPRHMAEAITYRNLDRENWAG